MDTKIGELWNQYSYHKTQLKLIEYKIKEFRNKCDHDWQPEEGYYFSGFYCRRCGSTK